MEKQGWKTLAIVCLALLIVETTLVVWVIGIGMQDIENEEMCIYKVCEDADTYAYVDGICQCYLYDAMTGEETILRTEILD